MLQNGLWRFWRASFAKCASLRLTSVTGTLTLGERQTHAHAEVSVDVLRPGRQGITEMIAAIRGPAWSLPMWIQLPLLTPMGRMKISVMLLLSSSSG